MIAPIDKVLDEGVVACLDSFTVSITSNLESADWSTRREILRTLIDRVLIEPEQTRIVYRINFPLFAKKASNAGSEKVLHFCWRSVMAALTRFADSFFDAKATFRTLARCA
jgi:broad specificity polyphosphatase/5'/3'-nucleotidase SurE